jgi:uncharacterized HAD superfamily protein
LNIAIDIDGTVIDTIGAVLKQFHPNITKESITNYKLDECIPNLTKERVIWEFEHLDQYLIKFIGKNTTNIIGMLDWSNQIENHLTYFLTSKTPKMMLWTLKFMHDYHIWIPVITSLKKQEYVDQFDILIEDNPAMIEYGIPLEKLRFIKQPWNQCLEEKGIKRYNEISEIIDELNL